jgi:hypothetical protein
MIHSSFLTSFNIGRGGELTTSCDFEVKLNVIKKQKERIPIIMYKLKITKI